ncbi:MAG: hypothetical protein R3A52_06970 [Polyangiales bacterium]
MSITMLATFTMLNLSDAWLDPQQERKTLEKWPRGKLLLPFIESAHADLFAASQTDTADAERDAELSQAAAEASDTHDRKFRAGWFALSSAAEASDDPAMSRRILALRDKLFPDGVEVVRWAYGAKAVNARHAAERLASVDPDVLRKCSCAPGVSLEKTLHAWIAAGKRLGEIEAARRKAGAPAEAKGHVARIAWVKVARQLETDAEFDALDADTLEAILGPMRREVAKATAKAEAKSKEKQREKEKAPAKPSDTKPADAKEAEKPTTKEDAPKTDAKPADAKEAPKPTAPPANTDGADVKATG